MTEVPAFVNNARLDVLAANSLAQALYAPFFADPGPSGQPCPLRVPRPPARDFCLKWEQGADDTVAVLRTEAGRDPYDRAMTGLIGDLHPNFETMELSAAPGLTLTALSAEAGSPHEDALRILARWAAHHPADALAEPGASHRHC
ncbi:hypothetical protein AB0P17_28875 [Streptomyces sp. NPDC088124]|uniref:MmyB family transcriptional regulator n=1 Tax=Streptomyces sp. NPDC088124 TaxID=3154654 RepID=UPI00341C3063